MRRRTLVTLLCTALLIATGLGMAAFTSPSSASQTCDCNLAANACLVAGQTCQACDCVSLDPKLDGVCK